MSKASASQFGSKKNLRKVAPRSSIVMSDSQFQIQNKQNVVSEMYARKGKKRASQIFLFYAIGERR